MNATQHRETDLLSTAQQQELFDTSSSLNQQPGPDPLEAYRFNLADLKTNYKTNHSTWRREAFKYAFSTATFGLGALYLWATTLVVKEGEVAMRRNARGEMILLPPGRHSNFPWEAYVRENSAPSFRSVNSTAAGTVRVQRDLYMEQSLQNFILGRYTVPVSENFIRFGPNTIFTVKTGYIAKTYRNGELVVFPAGQYRLEDAAHVVNREDAFISVQEETKTLPAVSALTKNNVPLKIQADVRYQIEDPQLAITLVDDIENTIFEIAKINISQVVSHHDLSEFVPVMADPSAHGEERCVNQDEMDSCTGDSSVELGDDRGDGSVLAELTRKITEQLKKMGIKLLSISTTGRTIDDPDLAHELGQVAVIQAKARSTMLAAEQAKKVKQIEAEAEAIAMRARAKGQADAVKEIGAAFLESADSMKENPTAAQFFLMDLQKSWFAGNPNLLFNIGGGNQATMPIMLSSGTGFGMGRADN